jgi:hypothetical protein
MPDLASQASAQMDHRDIIVMTLIERFNHEGVTRPNALSVAAHIKGAPINGVEVVLRRLARLEVLELLPETNNTTDYYVTSLGAEVLERDIEGWQPSSRENARRETYARLAAEATRSR